MISLLGNRGLFALPPKKIFTNSEFLYHLGYLGLCMLSFSVHPLFYGLLVKSIVFLINLSE